MANVEVNTNLSTITAFFGANGATAGVVTPTEAGQTIAGSATGSQAIVDATTVPASLVTLDGRLDTAEAAIVVLQSPHRVSTMTTGGTAAANATALQADIAAGGRILIPPGAYACNRVTIDGVTDLTIEGAPGAKLTSTESHVSTGNDDTDRLGMITLKGTITRLKILGLALEGSGDAALRQRGIGYDHTAAPTITGLTIDGCRTYNLVTHAIIPKCTNVRIIGNRFDTCPVGLDASGQGNGLVIEPGGGTPTDIIVTGNTFVNQQRHALYLNQTRGAVVNGNTFYQHRNAYSGASTGRAAVMLSRLHGCVCSHNQLIDCRDVGIGVDADSTNSVTDVQVVDNTIIGMVGTSVSAGRTVGTAFCEAITIANNHIEPAASWTSPDVQLTDVKGLRFTGNRFHSEKNFGATKTLIKLSEYAASYWEEAIIENNHARISTSSGSKYFIEVSSALAASSGGRLVFGRNVAVGATANYNFLAAMTNNKVFCDELESVEQVITTGTTPNVAGMGHIALLMSGATSITDFTNGRDYQKLTIVSMNGNATLTNAMYLAGGVNFVMTTNDVIVLQRMPATPGSGAASRWVEIARSVN